MTTTNIFLLYLLITAILSFVISKIFDKTEIGKRLCGIFIEENGTARGILLVLTVTFALACHYFDSMPRTVIDIIAAIAIPFLLALVIQSKRLKAKKIQHATV